MAEISRISGNAIVESNVKAEFLNMVAASFDNYVAKTGKEPESIVYILGGLGQDTSLAWHMTGNARGFADEVLCVASAHLMKQAVVR